MWNRLTAASATNGNWGEQYAFDDFGNLTGKTPTAGSAPAMNWPGATNQTSGTSLYDANGNPYGYSNGSGPGYLWDVENHLATDQTAVYTPINYTYDPWGRRVWKQIGTGRDNYGNIQPYTGEIYFYGATGQKLETYSFTWESSFGGSLEGINIYFGKKLLQSKGVWVATDKLGSVRANSSGESMSYWPYGEERDGAANGREKFATYTRDGVGQDYAYQRYYNSSTGVFWTPDPGGTRTADPSRPSSWNRYAYVEGDPVNSIDRHGLLLCAGCGDEDDEPDNPCDDEPMMIGCGGGGGAPPLPGSATSAGSGGGVGSSNPCAFGSLTGAQQSLLGSFGWGTQSAGAQQAFVTISADAAALGLNLAADGFTVSGITVAAEGGQSTTELDLSGGNVTQLLAQMGTNFTSQGQNFLVGSPHSGYTGNYRQNTLTWSMQINTGTDPTTGASIAQIDIDPYNPARAFPVGLLGHGVLQWAPNHITGGDTNYVKAAKALGLNVGSPCTGR